MAQGTAARAGNDRETAPETARVGDWDDWFAAVAGVIDDVKAYEEGVVAYHRRRGEDGAFARPHRARFWTYDRPLSRDQAMKVVRAGFVGFGVGFIAPLAYQLVALHGVDAASIALWAALATVVACALWAVPVLVSRATHAKGLVKLEEKTASVLALVPPKYRNSFCLSAFAEAHDVYGIRSFDGAVSAVDRYVAGNRRAYKPFAMMSDLAYDGRGVARIRRVAGAHDRSSKALPADIDAHTHEGPDDWRAEMDGLVGMDAIKAQVRKMENRIRFYGKDKGKSLGGNNAVFMGPAGSGKALADDTPIPVNDERGYVPIGDLVPGDIVFDESGAPTRVLGVYHQGRLPAWKISFVDKSSLVCNEEHMFAVRRAKYHRENGPYYDMNIHQMVTDGIVNAAGQKKFVTKFWIPENGALQRPDVELPLDPYVLGVLIGDGCLTGSGALVVSSNDVEVMNEVGRRLGAKARKLHKSNYSWSFERDTADMTMAPHRIRKIDAHHYISLKYLATKCDLPEVFYKKSYEKRIPQIYFRGSIWQRMALLQGLMDTDGSMQGGPRMHCAYSTTSSGLADDVALLASSLGFRSHIRSHGRGKSRPNARREYIVHITGRYDERANLFYKSIKRDRCEKAFEERVTLGWSVDRRYDDLGVANIEKLSNDVSMTCIYVDAPSHLYQAGYAHIVTHNTVLARIITGMLFDFGYIAENRIVEVDGDYLKSPYQGQTGERVSAICRWAEGGVLFIDEAYLLFDPSQSGGAGREATGVLLKEMEDRPDDLVVILAGYTDDMERLVASNEGFRSRIRHTFRFPAYKPSELAEILRLFLAKRDLGIAPAALKRTEAVFEGMAGNPGFGGAREARNAADRLIDIHADRGVTGKADEADEIDEGDVAQWAAESDASGAALRHDFLATMGVDSSIVSATELEGKTHKVPESPDRALARYVGQDAAKEQLASWAARIEMTGDATGNSNVCLAGPAGVGKTSMAEIITSYLYRAGRIREPRMLDVSGDWFRASYVGQTGKRTEAAIQWSRGGVLFIDEAYLLVDRGNQGFGAEAIGTLVNDMEKMDDLVVIVAGYTEDMRGFLDVNQGLASRIGTHIELSPYSVRELMLIFQRMARARGFHVAKDVYRAVQPAVERHRDDPEWGQGRAMARLLDKTVDAHAARWAADKSISKTELTVEDALRAVETLGW